MKTLFYAVTVFLVALSWRSGAQSYSPAVSPKDMLKSITPLTPDVAALGQFAIQPPELSDGLPRQQIPLVEIKENGLKYGLDLFYSYSGFKVKEDAGACGLGWGITEDVIIRIVKHAPDENSTLLKKFEDFQWDFTEEVGLPDPPSANSGTYTNPFLLTQEYNFTQNRLFYKFYDAQPDVYVYNCGGYSGKFLWVNGEATNLELNDVVIVGETISAVKQRFTLWTPEGVRYTFDEADKTWNELYEVVRPPVCDVSHPIESFIGHPYTTTWRVSKIKNNATKTEINFKYKSYVTAQVKDAEQISSLVFYAPRNPLGEYFTTDFGKIENYVKTMHQVFVLDEIISSNYKIDLTTKPRIDGGEFLIDSIKVFSNRNLATPVKVIAFQHGYFGNISHPSECWLKLQGLSIKGMGSDADYSFTYVDENFSSLSLDKDELAIDHWGYYNAHSNLTLVPLTGTIQAYIENHSNLPFQIISWANRDPDTLYNRIFALKTVQVPTKGITSYDYESANGRGIRVKTITASDGDSLLIRYYDYGPNMQIQPYYPWSEYTSLDICQLYYPFDSYSAMVTTFNAYADGPPDFLGDDSNFYENVTEFVGSADGRGGFTKYRFQKLFGYGNKVLLREKAEFEYGNDTFVRREESFYSSPVSNPVPFWRIPEMNSTPKKGVHCDTQDGYGPTCGPIDPALSYILGEFSGGIDYVYQVWIRLDSTISTTDGVKITTRFEYEPVEPSTSLPVHTRVKREEGTMSNGEERLVEIFYPGEDDPDNAQEKLGIPQMYDFSSDSVYLVSAPIKLRKWVDNVIVSTEVNEYSYEVSDDLILRTGYEWHPSGQPSEKDEWEIQYDNKGNTVFARKSHDVPVSFFYGYNQSLPVLRVENSDFNILESAIAASTLNFEQLVVDIGDMTLLNQQNAWAAFLGALRGHLPADSRVTAFTYVPLVGVTSETDPNGFSRYYSYDGVGRLSLVKDHDGNILKRYSYHYQE